MAYLEIVHISGEIDQKKLSKQQPLTIGSHPSTDICIDEDDVEIMHCRISWGKNGFEAVAAGAKPVEINGNLVQNGVLKPGDVLRFGSIDVRFRDSKVDGSDVPAPEASGEIGLMPLSEELPATPPASSLKVKDSVDEIDKDDLIDDDESPDGGSGEVDLFSGLQALAEESKGTSDSPPKKKKSKPSKNVKSSGQSAKPAKAAQPPKQQVAEKKASSPPRPVQRPDDELSPRMREALRSQRSRPGQEDPLRSPLVLGLGGGAVALVLAGFIFFFMAVRQTKQQDFDQAKEIYDEGKFQNAINEFQNFVIKYPRDDLSVEAKTFIGLAKIRQHVESAVPNFVYGLQELQAFIKENSDREKDFEVLHADIVNFAKILSLEAAIAAGKRYDDSLLQLSKDARLILTTYAPKDAPPTETLDQIEQELRKSEAEIKKNNVYKDHIARMEKAIAGEDVQETNPLEALKIRRDLLVRYPSPSPNVPGPFDKDKKLAELFVKAIELEKGKALLSDNRVEASTEDTSIPANPLTLAFHGRTKIDEVSVGRNVIAVAKDTCYGIDFVTGEPVWRRTIGFDSPFFPIEDSQLPSVILFDTNSRELIRLNQKTGQLIWKQPINDFVFGQPLLVDNTLYVATDAGKLLAVDLETGLLAGALQFSQTISAPVQLQDDEYLFVAGGEEVCYTISKRPFACVQVSYLGHQPASIGTPLLSMGPYVLVIENKIDSATMRMLEVVDAEKPAVEVATSELAGRVIDAPVIRGRSLFVPASGEQIHAFNISDDPGQPPLTAGPVFDGQGTKSESINLVTGPNGQVWLASDSLSKLQLTTDSLQPDGDPTAAGNAAQPLQLVSGYLFNGRRRLFTDAMTFTRTHINEQTSDWQVVLGAEVLAKTVRSEGGINIAIVNEAGQTFRIGERQLSDGNFLTNASERLPLHADLEDPLLAAEISGSRLAVVCGNPEPRLWIINAAGQIEGSPRIAEPVQAAPCSLGNRVVLPLSGKLQVARLSGQSSVQDFLLPDGEDQVWKNVTSVGTDQILAVTKQGLALLLKLQLSGQAHLTEVARLTLDGEIHVDAAANADIIAIADSSRKLTVFDTVRLDPQASKEFSQPVSNSPIIVDKYVFVELGSSELLALNQNDLSEAFKIPLSFNPVAGIVKTSSHLVVSQQDGTISYLNPESGELEFQQTVNAALNSAPVLIGKQLYVISIDGTLFQLNDPS